MAVSNEKPTLTKEENKLRGTSEKKHLKRRNRHKRRRQQQQQKMKPVYTEFSPIKDTQQYYQFEDPLQQFQQRCYQMKDMHFTPPGFVDPFHWQYTQGIYQVTPYADPVFEPYYQPVVYDEGFLYPPPTLGSVQAPQSTFDLGGDDHNPLTEIHESQSEMDSSNSSTSAEPPILIITSDNQRSQQDDEPSESWSNGDQPSTLRPWAAEFVPGRKFHPVTEGSG